MAEKELPGLGFPFPQYLFLNSFLSISFFFALLISEILHG